MMIKTREEATHFAECLKRNSTINFADMEVFCDMAIKALETVEEFEKAQIITGGRLNGRTYAYKCGLEDGRRKALEQEPVLDKVRNEIAECGSIWVAYAITGHSDRDIENLIEDVVKQAKEQVLNIIDKYRTESEVQNEV
jgi:hypothetical protein